MQRHGQDVAWLRTFDVHRTGEGMDRVEVEGQQGFRGGLEAQLSVRCLLRVHLHDRTGGDGEHRRDRRAEAVVRLIVAERKLWLRRWRPRGAVARRIRRRVRLAGRWVPPTGRLVRPTTGARAHSRSENQNREASATDGAAPRDPRRDQAEEPVIMV